MQTHSAHAAQGRGLASAAVREAIQRVFAETPVQRIHAMSSPTVSTVHPGMVGSSIARLVLPQADGNAAAR